MAIKLCLFDLDNTLLETSDLENFRGAANLRNTTPAYTKALLEAFNENPFRELYSLKELQALRTRFPQMKWGVFTRAPRHYADSLLANSYPGLDWDVVIGFEDVKHTKPHSEGVWTAMDATKVKYVNHVALVGDEKVDVQCAYQSGCWSILDQTSWGWPWIGPNYWAVERVPDAIIKKPSELGDVLSDPKLFLPELELRVEGGDPGNRPPRIDHLNHFFPVRGQRPVSVAVLGKLFAEYEELKPRYQWHDLTKQLLAHKDAQEFPDEWIQALRRYLKAELLIGSAVVTTIPFKPGRPPRLEALLAQLKASDDAKPILLNIMNRKSLTFLPALLAFKDAAVSSHGMHLSRDDRFINVGENLHVQEPQSIQGKRVVVIDDVVTTGASLLWAHRMLLEAGAQSVHCVALAKAVGTG